MNALYAAFWILISCLLLTAVVFALDKVQRAHKKACKEERKSKPFNPKLEWIDVPGDMERIEVDGGWIYGTYISGHSVTLCFVPFPKNYKAKKVEK